MVHAIYTPANLTTVVYAILFPIAALGAPSGAAVGLADEYISRIEIFKPGAIRVKVGSCCISAPLDIFYAVRPPRMFFAFRFSSLDSPRAERHHAWIKDGIIEGTRVGTDHQEKEDEVKNKNSNGSSIVLERTEQIVNCGRLR
jgi:hypothetical protein